MLRTIIITTALLTACTVAPAEVERLSEQRQLDNSNSYQMTDWDRQKMEKMLRDGRIPFPKFIVDHVCHDAGIARVEMSIGGIFDHFYTCSKDHWYDGLNVTADLWD